MVDYFKGFGSGGIIIIIVLEVTAASEVLRVVTIHYLLVKYLQSLEVKVCRTLL